MVPPLLYGSRDNQKDILEVTDESFEKDVLKSPLPVLVDFWSPWCTCCRQISSSVSKMADGHQGSLKVAKVNVEGNHAIPRRYGVNGLPTVLIFNNGKLVKKWVGNISEVTLEKEIQSLLRPESKGIK